MRKFGVAVGLALVVAWGSWLLAAPAVAPPSFTPSAVVVGQPALVTATVVIASEPGDPAVLANGVNLLRVDAAGRAVAIVGVMLDDGFSPDSVRGDGVFTLRFTVNESTPGAVNYRASVAFKGVLRRVLSEIRSVSVQPNTLDTQSAGPDGATLTFPRGVVFVIPPGALDELTTFEVLEVSAQEVDALFAAEGFTTHRKRFLGGFQVRPDVTFRLPVKTTFPVSPLRYGEIPVPIGMDVDAGPVRILPYQRVTYRGDLGVAEMEVWHFSGRGLAAAAPVDPQTRCMDGESADACHARYLGCLTCGYHDPIACAGFMPDTTEPPCCMVDAREACPTLGPCECCKERTVEIETGQTDVTQAQGCSLVGDSVKVTFRDCPGSSSVTSTLVGASAECPKDMKPELSITPTSQNLFVCEELPLQASVVGKSEKGDITFPADFVVWRSSDLTVVSLSGDTGPAVTGRAHREGLVRACAQVPNLRLEDCAPISVMNRLVEFEAQLAGGGTTLNPSELTLRVGDKFTVGLHVEGICERPLQCTTNVSNSNRNVISYDPGSGLVTAVGDGEATLEISLDPKAYPACFREWCAAEFTARVLVKVERSLLVQMARRAVRLGTGSSTLLTARVTDSATGELVNDAVVTWTSSDPEVASVSASGLVSGHSREGDVTVTAEVEGARATALVYVRRIMSLTIEPRPAQADVEIDVGSTVEFTVKGWSAAGTPETPGPLTWTTNRAGVAALEVPPIGPTAVAKGLSGNRTLVQVTLDDATIISGFDNLKLSVSVWLHVWDYHGVEWSVRSDFSSRGPTETTGVDSWYEEWYFLTKAYLRYSGSGLVRDGGPGYRTLESVTVSENFSDTLSYRNMYRYTGWWYCFAYGRTRVDVQWAPSREVVSYDMPDPGGPIDIRGFFGLIGGTGQFEVRTRSYAGWYRRAFAEGGWGCSVELFDDPKMLLSDTITQQQSLSLPSCPVTMLLMPEGDGRSYSATAATSSEEGRETSCTLRMVRSVGQR